MEDPLLNIVPGYREAVARESFLRNAAFLPVTDSIDTVTAKGRAVSVECLAFTPLHFAMLDVARSPFVRGGVPLAADLAAFLWAVSPAYHPRATFARWRALRSFRSLDYLPTLKAIHGYLADAFADAPGSKGESCVSYVSGTASIVDRFASEYGWTTQTTLNTPFNQLFQLHRCIQRRTVADPLFFNASDAVLGEWQDRQNRPVVATN
jgi:hypothetical protein